MPFHEGVKMEPLIKERIKQLGTDYDTIEQNQVVHALRTVSTNLQALVSYLCCGRVTANEAEMNWVKNQVKVDCEFLKELLRY